MIYPSMYMKKLMEANKEIERLRKALKKYGQHEDYCRIDYHPVFKCTCGLEQTLKKK